MIGQSILRSSLRWAAAGVGLAAGTYAACVGVTWLRYGHPPPPNPGEYDALLDRFMPVYEVVERRHVHVTAPAAVTLAVARDLDMFEVPVVRAVFKGPRTDPPGRSRQAAAAARVARRYAVAGMGGPGRDPGTGDCRRRRHQAVGGKRHVSLGGARGVRRVPRA